MKRLRMGGPLYEDTTTPEKWIRALAGHGYRAAYAPVSSDASPALIKEYRQAAKEHDIVITEVGAWLCHPLSDDRAKAREGIEKTAKLLTFADALGARCCVNVSTSRGEPWDGPDPRNLTEETFGMVVESIREILRMAQPKEACYALEMMPWMFPTSLADQQRLLEAVNHPNFAVHYDPCNCINSVEKYFANGVMMEAFVDALHPKMKSIHLKDVRLMGHMTVHLEECRPGLGQVDHGALFRALLRHEEDIPVTLEHLKTAEEYDQAAAYVRMVARQAGFCCEEPKTLV